ncbi:MAG: hypothetical protein HKP35_06630 [Silicimonas sp.]|nr:hypothetical protein [Silicimonas sp.]
MRFCLGIACVLLLTACGSDIAGDNTAAVARQNAAARDAAQEGRILNPAALACIKASSSEQEWAVIASETGAAPSVLQDVLGRQSTIDCFRTNDVVIYI